MKQVRLGVFETNSSSSHSISIMKKGSVPDAQSLENQFWTYNGVLEEWGDDIEFGRTPFQVLTTPRERMRYAIASYATEDKFMDIEEIICRRVPTVKEIKLPECDRWHHNYSDDNTRFYGYVDHESMDVLPNFLNTHGITLEDFIFDNRYIVWVDGDEYQIKETMVDVGIVDKDNFEEL